MSNFMLSLGVIISFLYISYASGSSFTNIHDVRESSSQQNRWLRPPTSTIRPTVSQNTLTIRNNMMSTNRSSFGIYPLIDASKIEDLLNKSQELLKSSSSELYQDVMIANRSDNALDSTDNFFPPTSVNNHQPSESEAEQELEKIELHTNNHQSISYGPQGIGISNNNNNNIMPNVHNSRHYSSYQVGTGNSLMGLTSGAGAHYNKYASSHSHNSNSFNPNNLNLNHIHNLLLTSKPTSSSSLSSLLNFNSNSLSLTSSPYSGLSLQNGYVSSYYSAPSLITSSLGSSSSPSSTNSMQQQQQQQQQGSSSYSSLSAQKESLQNLSESTLISPLPVSSSSSSSSDNNINNNLTSLLLPLSGDKFNTNSIDFDLSSLCGKQQVGAREPRIVGGNSTYEGEFPWAVSIQRQGYHHCGGVIVGRRWILTAAHCVRSQLVGNLVVRTGGHTLSRSSNHITSHLGRDYLVEQIVMHDDFSRYDNLTASQMKSSANTNNADIALLRLKQDIHWNDLAWPVCFPNREAGNFSGHDAVVIGWGKLNEKSEDFSNELQKVKLTIIDNKVCQNWFRQAGRDMPIDDRIICAGFKNGGKDACHGDSGGPLLSKINGHYVVVGVVSTGIGCARPLLPGLYSRVSSYIGWIERYVT